MSAIRRASAALLGVCVVTLGIAAPANAVGDPVVTHTTSKWQTSIHFDPNPECGALVGTTEYQSGTDHLTVVEDGNTLHVTLGSSFTISEVSDDPNISPPPIRHGSDAIAFELVNDGSVVVFHETFHDQPTGWGNIALYTTFVAVDGDVKVDHFLGRDLPDEGC